MIKLCSSEIFISLDNTVTFKGENFDVFDVFFEFENYNDLGFFINIRNYIQYSNETK